MIDDLLIGMFLVLGVLILWHIIDDVAWRIRRWRIDREMRKRLSRLNWRYPLPYDKGE